MTDAVPVHLGPLDGSSQTQCCDRNAHELLAHRMTYDETLVTCTGPTMTKPCVVCGHSNDNQIHHVLERTGHLAHPYTPALPGGQVIDAAHLERQRAWSTEVFGPGRRTGGILDHIGKELDEIRAEPTDLHEWVDVVILGLDGAWRAGWEPQQIIDAIIAKQGRNESRVWPDWRGRSEDEAIEHDRSG